MATFFWTVCYIVGVFFAMVSIGGWAYCCYTMLQMGMRGHNRTMAQSWPYCRRMLMGVAVMFVAGVIASLLFNPAADYLFAPR